ncbi:hypothetical protein [Saccharomonospora saliphila]|uniref:hypothetical protein n=1 Tax=Saccharomonospora saliphila TaxID=369829 RepID=UPI00037067F3|nr:hypothetical protein [Saccharomonospora saliphila]
MFDGVARWWDGVELWLAQLWFPFQFVLVAVVLVPLCLGLAWVVERAVDVVGDGLRRLGGRGPSARADSEGGRGALP